MWRMCVVRGCVVDVGTEEGQWAAWGERFGFYGGKDRATKHVMPPPGFDHVRPGWQAREFPST